MISAKDIRIEAIHISRTYGGVLEGLPTTEDTTRHARELAKKMWGERATMLIPPATTKLERPPRLPAHMKYPLERCPSWTIIAWLNGPAMDKANDGSELVVIWFEEDITYQIPGALLHDFGCGSWERYAKDWQF